MLKKTKHHSEGVEACSLLSIYIYICSRNPASFLNQLSCQGKNHQTASRQTFWATALKQLWPLLCPLFMEIHMFIITEWKHNSYLVWLYPTKNIYIFQLHFTLMAPFEMLPTGPLSCTVLSSNLLIFHVHFFSRPDFTTVLCPHPSESCLFKWRQSMRLLRYCVGFYTHKPFAHPCVNTLLLNASIQALAKLSFSRRAESSFCVARTLRVTWTFFRTRSETSVWVCWPAVWFVHAYAKNAHFHYLWKRLRVLRAGQKVWSPCIVHETHAIC